MEKNFTDVMNQLPRWRLLIQVAHVHWLQELCIGYKN